MSTHDTDATERLITEVVKESKAGYKTTEFWLTIVASALIALEAIPLPEKYQGIALAAVAVGYVISRGIAKKGVPDIQTIDTPSA